MIYLTIKLNINTLDYLFWLEVVNDIDILVACQLYNFYLYEHVLICWISFHFLFMFI